MRHVLVVISAHLLADLGDALGAFRVGEELAQAGIAAAFRVFAGLIEGVETLIIIRQRRSP